MIRATVKSPNSIRQVSNNAGPIRAKPVDIKAYNDDDGSLCSYLYSGRTYYVVNPIMKMEENTTSEDHNVQLTGNLEFEFARTEPSITQYTYQAGRERYRLPVQPHTGG